jgi:CheY-like chemotaxis protein
LRELDLNPLVAEMGSMLTRLLQENIQIQTHLCREAAMVLVDPGQMEQVLMNLCLNARDAITDSGQIVLETSHVDIRESRRDGDDDIPPGRYVRLSVRDDGIGMDAETLARIFEPFYTTKPFGKGTGLGLATVHGIIRQSQGHIEVTSQPNRGTTFTIHLPAAENRPLPTPDVRAVAEATGRVATILVVDDNAAIRQLVVTLLQSPDRRILEAENGEAALEVCRGYPDEIDLMITDVLMPGMDGYSLAGVLKESRPQLKVLYISGHAEDVVRHLGIGYDQIDFLRKPFSVDVLQKRVAEGLAGERVKSRGG